MTTDTWQRGERVSAYLSPRRARYPSVTWGTDGWPLILFTRQTEQQEAAGTGDLCVVRRTADGKWWHVPQIIHRGNGGEPRAYGTMTTLSSGRIIAPFFQAGSANRGLRMLASEDGGATWQVEGPIAVDPLVWAAPYGSPIELDGSLVMPVFGVPQRSRPEIDALLQWPAALHGRRLDLGRLVTDRGH